MWALNETLTRWNVFWHHDEHFWVETIWIAFIKLNGKKMSFFLRSDRFKNYIVFLTSEIIENTAKSHIYKSAKPCQIFQIINKWWFIKLCVKSFHIKSFSGPFFPALGLNTESYSVNIRIRCKCGKIWTRKSPNTDTFYAVNYFTIINFLLQNPMKCYLSVSHDSKLIT